MVASREVTASLQPRLLALDLGAQRRVLLFQHRQPPDVGAVRGADQVRQHVHVAERPPDAVGSTSGCVSTAQ